MEFACGERARKAARADYAALWHAATLLSCSASDVPSVIGKTLEERRATHGAAKRLEGRLAEHEARTLLGAPVTGADGVRLVAAVIEDATPSYLTLLAARLVAEGVVVALLGAKPGGHLVFAQARGATGDMGALAREAFQEFGGKGGGAKDFAQGALSDGSLVDQAIESVKRSFAAETQRH